MRMSFGKDAEPSLGGGFELLPQGEYRCTVTAPPDLTADSKGTPGLMIELAILEPAGFESRKPRYFLWLHESGPRHNRTMYDFLAFGFKAKAGQDLEFDPAHFVGRTCAIKVTGTRKYQDKKGQSREVETFHLFPDPGAGKLAEPGARPKSIEVSDVEIPF